MTTTRSLLQASFPAGKQGAFGSNAFNKIAGEISSGDTNEPPETTPALNAFTISNFALRVITSEAAIDTYRVRVAAANGNGLISVGSGLTGWFSDGSHTDSISAGQNYNYVRSQSGFGNAISIYSSVIQKSNPLVAWAVGNNGGVTGGVGTTVGYQTCIGALDRQPVEAVMQLKVRAAGTWQGLAARVTAFTGTVTFKSRKNGADGNQIATTTNPAAAAIFQDGSHTDSISSGDLIDTSGITSVNSTNLNMMYSEFAGTISAHDLATVDTFAGTGLNLSASTTYYFPLSGATVANTTESAVQQVLPYAITLSKLRVNVGTNSAASVTFKSRKNGADGNQAISVTSGQTGEFEDGSHTDSYSSTDTLDISGATGTLTNLKLISVRALLDDGSFSGSDTGTIAQTFTGISQAASGGQGETATIDQTFSGFSQAASGYIKPIGAITQTFSGFSQQAHGIGAPGAPRSTQIVRLVPAMVDAHARASQLARLAIAGVTSKGRASQVGRLTVSSVTVQPRTSQVARLIIGAAVPCGTTWCQCWRITRKDGVIFRFTSLDEDLPWGLETFSACGSLNPSASESGTSLGQVGNVELTGIIDSQKISAGDLYGGLFDDAYVEVWLVDYEGTDTPKRIAAGWTGELSQEAEGSFKMEVIGPGARLQQQALVQPIAPRCRWKFGDDRCQVDREARALSGEVMFAKDRGDFTGDIDPGTLSSGGGLSSGALSSGEDENASQWPNGTVRFESGRNAGATEYEIKTVDFETGEIVLWAPAAYAPEAGDRFTMLPGCAQDEAACKLYDNFDNFGGFPDVPGDDAITTGVDVTAQ